jgi:hypothetical protein
LFFKRKSRNQESERIQRKPLAVEKMKGSLNLASSKATVSILQGSGNIEFDAKKGFPLLSGLFNKN